MDKPTDEELIERFEDHDCKGSLKGYCDVCGDYLWRFNRKRYYELGLGEDSAIEEIMLNS